MISMAVITKTNSGNRFADEVKDLSMNIPLGQMLQVLGLYGDQLTDQASSADDFTCKS